MFSKFKGNPSVPAPALQEDKPVTPPSPDIGRRKAEATSLPGVLAQPQKPAIVSEQFTVRGDIDSDGVLHVEGRVIGVVKAHTIYVSATGHIEGDVICESLSVKGHVEGTLTCDELTIAASAHVTGQLSYRFITVGAGARVNGVMSIRGSE